VTEELGLIPIDSEAKRKGAAALQNIRAAQMTNLSGGLFQSIAQVKEDAKDEDETNPGKTILLYSYVFEFFVRTCELCFVVDGWFAKRRGE